nr:hypothetical protein [Tanacetum cinerariifolium]
WQQLAARCGVEVAARWWQRVGSEWGYGDVDGEVVWFCCRPRMDTKGVVAAAVVTAVVVVAAGWRGDGAAREVEWRGGSNISGDRESFWVRQKKPAGKVFRQRQRSGRPAVGRVVGG